jgi:hypothetical protein
LTVPFPDPDAPLEIVTQAALLVAVQAHPAPVDTATLPVLAAAPADVLVGVIVTAQGSVKTNWFERPLRPTPPGPTATTRASNVVPVGKAANVVVRSIRMTLLVFGAGLPSELV